ncbi:hypothetical protein CQW23_27004 [Capsicum baccatum]|uniref:ABC transporter family G domain-containing protein n=1 Tax=Capsicum baccatum TaxID=33114 RepID=A0A2G2VQE9_CAPBA|nr:hypothetical protein CQW23_27004 [Capsicum baccatum]
MSSRGSSSPCIWKYPSAATATGLIRIHDGVWKQRLREARLQAVDCLILLLAGICLGKLADVSDEPFGFMGYLYTVIAVLAGVATSCLDPVASKDSAFTAIVGDYIYSKWALEAFIIANDRKSGESFSIVSKFFLHCG